MKNLQIGKFKFKITKKAIIISSGILIVVGLTIGIYFYMKGKEIIDPSNAGVSSDMLDTIRNSEGLELTAYQDTGGKWTIGYGHTGNDVYSGLTITEGQAEQLLEYDVQNAVATVLSKVSVPLTQDQLDALTDFIFNTGASTSSLFTFVNSNDWQGAANFLQTHYITDANGNQLAGLVTRRNNEANLLIS